MKDEIPNEQIFLGTKVYKSYEKVLGEKDEPFKYTFLYKDNIIRTPIIRTEETSSMLLNSQFYMSPNKLEVRRTTYGLFDVLTELGGLIKIVQIAANVLVTPISRFLYFLVMIKRLFLVETDTDVAFRNDYHESHRSEQPGGRGKYLDIRQIPADLEGTGFEDDVTRHKQIELSTWDKSMLFLYISLPCL